MITKQTTVIMESEDLIAEQAAIIKALKQNNAVLKHELDIALTFIYKQRLNGTFTWYKSQQQLNNNTQ